MPARRRHAPQRRARAATLRQGLGALAKSGLLLVGVPAALARLWVLSSPPGRPLDLAGALGAHLVLAAVGAGWLVAGATLARDLAGALARKPLDTSTWSRRWAVRLAALVLMLAAGAGAGATGRARTVPARPAGSHAAASAPRAPAVPGGSALPAPLLEAAAAAGLGALVAGALARRARVLRRASAALRRAGERLPQPAPTTARLEALLGPSGDAHLLDWVDGANRLLWRSLRAAPAGTPVPEVALVRVGPDGVELLLERRALEPLDGFVALEEGAWWCLDPALDLAALARRTEGCGRLLPALVPLGEDGTATYLLHVASDQRLAVSGDPARAARALRGIVVALRCLPWADELGVELLGIDPPAPDERSYHLSASSAEELEALATGPAGDPASRCATTWARQPLVVSALPPTLEHEALLGRCRGRAGVVSLGGRGDRELVLDDAGAWLEPLGLRLTPGCPSPEQLELADRLLADAGSPGRPPAPRPSLGAAPTATSPRTAPVAPAPPGRVELRLLDGPARLDGASGDAVAVRDRGRVVELVTFLCLNGGRAAPEALLGALFATPAGRGRDAERLERLLAAARAALGHGADGAPLLGRSQEGSVLLHGDVTCDALRLDAAAQAAQEAPPEEAMRILRAALEPVGPGPCCPPPWPGWLAGGGRREDILATVVDAAHHLALLALAGDDTVLARWAIEKGRTAEPSAELLARDLMLACDADGDPAGAARAFRALEEALAGLGGNEPTEETRELFGALSRRAR